MHKSKLEQNLARIRHNPEAMQTFENIMAAWVMQHGEPDEEDLEILTDITLQEVSWWYNPLRLILACIVFVLVVMLAIKHLC
jgi:hypothetical protein